MIIAHIITGMIGGPLLLNFIKSQEILGFFAETGIAFLLFAVGLKLTPGIIKKFGKTALLTGAGQIIFTFLTGLVIIRWLGFSLVPAMYISIALTFSSTIVIVKLLSDKNALEKLYSRIAVGFLIVQDIVVILLLFLLPAFSQPEIPLTLTIINFMRGILFATLVFWLAVYILPRLDRFMARSAELLFLFSLGWGMGLAVLFQRFGFSLESGALIAGVSLSILPSHHEIYARLKPLRDFFILLFFIFLGSQVALTDLGIILRPAFILSAFVLIGNPLILISVMGLLGFRKKTSFQTGLTVAQVSEFSFILIALGVRLGHLEQEILSLVTLVGLVTIAISSYFIQYSENLYPFLKSALTLFERRQTREKLSREPRYEVILFGHNRMGTEIVHMLQKKKFSFLVIDHDPDLLAVLNANNIPSEYGDASDIDFISSLPLSHVKMVISTIPDMEINLLIVRTVRKFNPNTKVVAVAHDRKEAIQLYEEGVEYVIMPHFLGARHATMFLRNFAQNREKLAAARQRHYAYLKNHSDPH